MDIIQNIQFSNTNDFIVYLLYQQKSLIEI